MDNGDNATPSCFCSRMHSNDTDAEMCSSVAPKLITIAALGWDFDCLANQGLTTVVSKGMRLVSLYEATGAQAMSSHVMPRQGLISSLLRRHLHSRQLLRTISCSDTITHHLSLDTLQH